MITRSGVDPCHHSNADIIEYGLLSKETIHELDSLYDSLLEVLQTYVYYIGTLCEIMRSLKRLRDLEFGKELKPFMNGIRTSSAKKSLEEAAVFYASLPDRAKPPSTEIGGMCFVSTRLGSCLESRI